MATRQSDEFKIAVRDISQFALVLLGPFDRVRTAEWLRKLTEMEPTIDNQRSRNEYAQMLRIQVRGGVLHGPFRNPPPEGVSLIPLAEALGNHISAVIKDLPKPGPIAPIMTHRTSNGQVYVAAKQIPNGGVFCYMACSPDSVL